MKKIVIDARESGTSTGRYIDKLVEYLAKLKPSYDVVVLTKSHRLDYLRSIAPDFNITRSDYREFTFSEQLGFGRQLKKLEADLVHFGMTQQPVLYKGPKITTIHDLTTVRYGNPAKNPAVFKVKQKVYERVIKRVAAESGAVITPSRFVKQDVAQYANIRPDKIFVTYEAADRIKDTPRALPRLEGKRFILYVGRALPHKNLPRLVRAFELVRKTQPDLLLALAGQYDANYRSISRLASARRIADAVVFTDFVSEGELRWLYENTAAYVFPSLSEGFGLPPLEAMIHGAPVISSNATCLPEINGDAAHYFDPRSTRDIAVKTSEVLSNAKLRSGLIEKGRRQAAKYSWQKMAKQTLEIYRTLV